MGKNYWSKIRWNRRCDDQLYSKFHYRYLYIGFTDRCNDLSLPQIIHWHVMYEGVPECALNPSITWGYNGDTLYQGENMKFYVAIQNIGDYDMDSLQIRYYVVDANNTAHDY